MIWEELFHRLWFPGFVGDSIKVYQSCSRGAPEIQDKIQAYFPHVMGECLNNAILLIPDHDFWFSVLLFIFPLLAITIIFGLSSACRNVLIWVRVVAWPGPSWTLCKKLNLQTGTSAVCESGSAQQACCSWLQSQVMLDTGLYMEYDFGSFMICQNY